MHLVRGIIQLNTFRFRLQIGSVALVGLYTVVKYLGEKWINWLLGWYFSIAGVGSVWNVSNTVKCCALCGAEKILKLFPFLWRTVLRFFDAVPCRRDTMEEF